MITVTKVEGLSKFQDIPQFTAIAERLALRAAQEVGALRKKFASLPDIARRLVMDARHAGWPLYHAAVASGLVGDIAKSQALFGRLIEEPAAFDWHRELQTNSAELAQTLINPAEFRAAILAIIQKSRALHKLPPDPTCLNEIEANQM